VSGEFLGSAILILRVYVKSIDYRSHPTFLTHHSGRERRNPGIREVIGGVRPAFWMPSIHAGMTNRALIDRLAMRHFIQAIDFASGVKMRIAVGWP